MVCEPEADALATDADADRGVVGAEHAEAAQTVDAMGPFPTLAMDVAAEIAEAVMIDRIAR